MLVNNDLCALAIDILLGAKREKKSMVNTMRLRSLSFAESPSGCQLCAGKSSQAKVPTVIAKVVQVCNWTELCVAQVYCQFLENIPTNVYHVSGGAH